MGEEAVGKVAKYFSHVGAAVVEVTKGTLNVGDKIAIRGHTTKLEQTVDSMELEHQSVQSASPGQAVGIKVKDRVRPQDVVYKITPD